MYIFLRVFYQVVTVPTKADQLRFFKEFIVDVIRKLKAYLTTFIKAFYYSQNNEWKFAFKSMNRPSEL